MIAVDLERIDGFSSPGEYARFERWIEERVQRGELEPAAVRARYSGLHTTDERWYRTLPEGKFWRLVAPDPPFTGVFEPVEEIAG